jgi:hypothetical protein
LTTGHWELAIVDLNNDGQLDAVYRKKEDTSGHTIEYLAVSSPVVLEQLLPQQLSYDRYLEIVGDLSQDHSFPLQSNLVWLHPKTTTPANSIYFIDGNDDYFFDIIQFEGKFYILAASVVTTSQAQRVFVLEYESPRALAMLCQFRGPE